MGAMDATQREQATPGRQRAVLQVFNQYLEPGGEELWVNVLARDMGLPVCLFRSAEWQGADAPAQWKQALRMLRNPEACARLRDKHRKTGAEAWLFHNVFPVGSAGLYREALRLGVPVIQYTHSFRPFSISGYLTRSEVAGIRHRLRTYGREILRGAWQNSAVKTAWYATVLTAARAFGWFRAVKAWIAVSDFMRDTFIEAGVPADDIFTVRHYWKPRSGLPVARDDRYYLFLGRLVEMKGIDVLLKAWEMIRDETASRGPRLFVAGHGELAPVVRAAAEKNSLVVPCGQVSGETKEQLLAGCSAVVAPSICLESFGLVAFEAYDFGKPILAANSGGLAETVSHGQTGLLHEPGDAAQLARQVLELDASPERRVEMGHAGRAWLLENTSEKEWLRKFTQVVDYAVRQM